MEKVEIIGQLNAKYNEIFPQYFEMLMKHKESPNDLEIKKMFDFLQSNVNYIEKYLSLVEILDKDEMKKALEKNNCIKELTDSLYEIKENNNNLVHNPKIEIVEQDCGVNEESTNVETSLD